MLSELNFRNLLKRLQKVYSCVLKVALRTLRKTSKLISLTRPGFQKDPWTNNLTTKTEEKEEISDKSFVYLIKTNLQITYLL